MVRHQPYSTFRPTHSIRPWGIPRKDRYPSHCNCFTPQPPHGSASTLADHQTSKTTMDTRWDTKVEPMDTSLDHRQQNQLISLCSWGNNVFWSLCSENLNLFPRLHSVTNFAGHTPKPSTLSKYVKRTLTQLHTVATYTYRYCHHLPLQIAVCLVWK